MEPQPNLTPENLDASHRSTGVFYVPEKVNTLLHWINDTWSHEVLADKNLTTEKLSSYISLLRRRIDTIIDDVPRKT